MTNDMFCTICGKKLELRREVPIRVYNGETGMPVRRMVRIYACPDYQDYIMSEFDNPHCREETYEDID